MDLRLKNVNEANEKFAERERLIAAECEELSNIVYESINAAEPDTKNRFELLGLDTCRVVYVDASAFWRKTVETVAQAYRDAGYVVCVMTMDTDDPASAMVMMAFSWDPCATQVMYDTIAATLKAASSAVEESPQPAEDLPYAYAGTAEEDTTVPAEDGDGIPSETADGASEPEPAHEPEASGDEPQNVPSFESGVATW